jgi:multidrug efflux system outer membrane protein
MALVFSGCAIGPDYIRPETALPERYDEGAETLPAAEVPAVNPEWWTLFRDEELNHLMELALANNHDLKAAVARMEAAEAAAREAGSDIFPSVDLEGGSIRNRASGKTASGRQTGAATTTNRRLALNIGYELDLWGRIRRLNEAAGAEALAGRFGHDALRLSLAGQITSGYLTLRVLDAELGTTARMRESHRQTLEIVRRRLDAGASSALEAAQARASLAAVDAQWNALRRQRALTENLLALLTGQPGLRVAESADFNDLPLPPLPPAGLPSSLLEARPDIREAEERLAAANARIGVAKAAYFPSISLTGLLGSESANISDLFGGQATIWSYGATLFMPIFNWGRTGARLDQVSAVQREALENYLKTVENAFREVRDALVSLREYQAEAAAFAAQTEAAREAWRIAGARYEAGYSGFLELLDSQRTLNAAEIQQQDARRNHLAAAVDLFKALGGGWREAEGSARVESGPATAVE